MTLILLLIVLVTERVALQGSRWRVESYLRWYAKYPAKTLNLKSEEALSLFILVVFPALIIGLFLWLFGNLLIEFVVSLLILAVAVGHSKIRTYYRQFLNAAQRDDTEAMEILKEKLDTERRPELNSEQSTKDAEQEASIEDTDPAEQQATEPRRLAGVDEVLIWQNFKFYAAPIFYFVIFGVPGVVAYSTLLFLTEDEVSFNKLFKREQRAQVRKTLMVWLEYAYFVPARFVALGYMFVGHFSNGLEAWLKNAVNVKVSSRDMLVTVSKAADGNENDPHGRHMVKLAKRNMVLFIVVVALMTLYGQIV